MMMIFIRTWHIWVIACVFWRWFVWFCVLRLYSRPLGFPSVNSEKTKIEVYCIHFSRLSPVSKFTRKTGLGAILKSPFREIAVLPPQSQNRQSADISRGSSAQRPGYRPTHVLHATVPILDCGLHAYRT